MLPPRLRGQLLLLLPLRSRRGHGRRRMRASGAADAAVGAAALSLALLGAHAAAAAVDGGHLGVSGGGGVLLVACPLQVMVVPGASVVALPARPAAAARGGADGLPLVDGGQRGDGLGEEEDAPVPALRGDCIGSID